MSKFINQKKIMTYETIILLAITLTTATIAWFVAKNNSKITGINIKAADSDYIKVSYSADGEDVLNIDENQREISISLANLTNVREGELAPGTYGSMNVFITPINSDANAYKIVLKMQCDFMDGDLSVDMQKSIKKMVSGHILFFDSSSNVLLPTLSFASDDSVSDIELSTLSGDLGEVGETTKVTIDWKWPYELVDVPVNIRPESELANKLEKLQLYDCFKYDENDTDFQKYSKNELFDYADTAIATYVKDIVFKLQIEGY